MLMGAFGDDFLFYLKVTRVVLTVETRSAMWGGRDRSSVENPKIAMLSVC